MTAFLLSDIIESQNQSLAKDKKFMNDSFDINGKSYAFATGYKDHNALRGSLNALTRKTFGFDFEQWYLDGYWKKRYVPYSLSDNGTIIANVSVNIMDFLIEGETMRYIQLGTVMTDEAYRGQGLSRALLEKALSDWEDKCDLTYLFANDSVVDFYPKFGFTRADEYQCSKALDKSWQSTKARKLDMSSKTDRTLLENTIANTVPFSKVSMLNNTSLVLFYCTSFMKDDVYYIDKYDAAAIARYEEDTLLLLDIFCTHSIPVDDIINVLAKEQTRRVVLGFTPLDGTSFETNLLHEENTTLFIKTKKENIFEAKRYMFPALSHA